MSGYEALRNTAAWIDLSSRGKIRATGEDRTRLLHAMSTNDLQHLTPGSGLYALFLNEKGRILADACIYNLGENLFLDTEPETAGKLRDHLDKYIIADDVYLEDQTATWAAIGLEGPQSISAASGIGISVPENKYGVREWGGGFAAHVSSTGREGIRVFLPQPEKATLVQHLVAAGLAQATSEEARTVRLENGAPRYGDEISERYLVQEAQVMHAVHLNKGCYLGQEIVERVRSRGQVHRLLAPVRIKTNAAPAPGTRLLANGEPAAEIASAVFSPALGEAVGFAYVKAQALQDTPEMTVDGTDPVVSAYIR